VIVDVHDRHVVRGWLSERRARRQYATTLVDFERDFDETVRSAQVVATHPSNTRRKVGHGMVAYLCDIPGDHGPWAWAAVVVDDIGQYTVARGSARRWQRAFSAAHRSLQERVNDPGAFPP
jgi:hypothetical protein